jgi:trimethylamine--corrinoid protein Co-methyltransferase
VEGRVQTRIQILSEDEKAQVHERTLKVLATTGMRCDTEEGRRILAAAGADVDEATRRVRFPAGLVEDLLAQAPRAFALHGRRPGWSFTAGAGDFTLLADGGATSVYDVAAGLRRTTTRDDWRAATRLLDALDDVGLYWCPTEYDADYERPGGFVRYFTDVFATFGKHVQDSFGTPELAPWLKEVLDIVFGGPDEVRRSLPLSFLVTPASPLTIEHDYTQTWLELRDYGLPVAVMPMPMQGATAPGSRLGTLLAANCETVGTMCLVQAAAPGTPVFYSPVVATMDPRTGLYAAGAPEHAVLCAAGTEMARYYDLPAESSGLCTQTYEPDLQTAWEKADGGLLAVLAGPDVLVGPGLLGGATVLCLEQIVLDVEVVRRARQARMGVPVRDDLWLDEVLEAAGPGGSFIGERSTRNGVRGGEWRLSDFGVQGSWDSWRAAGSPHTIAAATERVRDVLASHAPLPYSEDQAAALAALQRRADAAS